MEAELPFSARTAYQLREATRSATGGTVPMERLPGSTRPFIRSLLLKPPLLKEAEREGLIRPELKRAELIERRRRKSGAGEGEEEVRSRSRA